MPVTPKPGSGLGEAVPHEDEERPPSAGGARRAGPARARRGAVPLDLPLARDGEGAMSIGTAPLTASAVSRSRRARRTATIVYRLSVSFTDSV